MGVKSFFHELKAKVSPHRLFKALVTEAHEHSPKFNKSIKSVEIIEGEGFVAGCVVKTTFADSSPIKYVKHRIDEIDTENCVCKYTLFEGDILGDKLEKICYELKFEATEDGGCAIKQNSEYYTKGDVVLNDDEIKAGKDQAAVLYKACEDYLCDNPDVCA